MKKILILLTILIVGCSKDEILTPIEPKPPIVEIIKKNYKKTSYELSNYDNWFDGNSIYENGISYRTNNPLNEQQSCQIDFNGDGIEDIFAYDGYDLKINPTPNPPPVVYLNDGSKLNRVVTGLTSIKNPHASKILIGDFDGDSLPDIFSSVAIDQPNGVLFPTMTDVSHLIFNSKNGFNRVKEFDEAMGYWYTSCSGDIDNDNDLDIIMFNFHQLPPIGNGVKSRILRNDGIGNFKSDTTGIGNIPFVSESELVDINKDGFLDLVISYNIPTNTPCPCNIPTNISILWGNGKEFNLNNSTKISLGNNINIVNMDFMNIDNDNRMEILISASDEFGKFYIELFKSETNGVDFLNKTSTYIDNNMCNRFAHMRVQDIDKNGKLDLFSGDRRENNRWEWNGFKFIKQ